ncbi:hypothetical protein THOG05_130101 [Vibrio rotiferianus]|nr:hypothetical protein THOG05_130101 [Vibrio rotiferianus]
MGKVSYNLFDLFVTVFVKDIGYDFVEFSLIKSSPLQTEWYL